MECRVKFSNDRTLDAFERLLTGKSEDRDLYRWIDGAIDDIKANCDCGVFISKRLFPKKYKNLDNLWKYDLPHAWRLLYTTSNVQSLVIVTLLEWLPHKKYERLFGY